MKILNKWKLLLVAVSLKLLGLEGLANEVKNLRREVNELRLVKDYLEDISRAAVKINDAFIPVVEKPREEEELSLYVSNEELKESLDKARLLLEASRAEPTFGRQEKINKLNRINAATAVVNKLTAELSRRN